MPVYGDSEYGSGIEYGSSTSSYIDSFVFVHKDLIKVGFTGNVVANSDYLNPDNYVIEKISGNGPNTIKVLQVYDKGVGVRDRVMLKTRPHQYGSRYRLTINNVSKTNGVVLDDFIEYTARETKVGSALASLPSTYNKAPFGVIRTLVEAAAVSDDRIGGNEGLVKPPLAMTYSEVPVTPTEGPFYNSASTNIIGQYRIGSKLYVAPGDWLGVPDSIEYRWEVDSVPVSTEPFLELREEYVGASVYAYVNYIIDGISVGEVSGQAEFYPASVYSHISPFGLGAAHRVDQYIAIESGGEIDLLYTYTPVNPLERAEFVPVLARSAADFDSDDEYTSSLDVADTCGRGSFDIIIICIAPTITAGVGPQVYGSDSGGISITIGTDGTSFSMLDSTSATVTATTDAPVATDVSIIRAFYDQLTGEIGIQLNDQDPVTTAAPNGLNNSVYSEVMRIIGPMQLCELFIFKHVLHPDDITVFKIRAANEFGYVG